MIVEFAFDHLLRRLHHGLTQLRIELAECHVGLRAGTLHNAERADNGLGLCLPADLEVAEAPLRLGAPIAIARHLDRAERIGFRAGGFRFVSGHEMPRLSQCVVAEADSMTRAGWRDGCVSAPNLGVHEPPKSEPEHARRTPTCQACSSARTPEATIDWVAGRWRGWFSPRQKNL